MEELYDAYKRYGLTLEDFLGARYQRIEHIRRLLRDGRIDATLRWRPSSTAATAGVARA